MFKKLVPAVFFIAFLFLSTGSILAEAVVVKGDNIFVADGGLSVWNIDDEGSLGEAECSGGLVVVTTDATGVVITDDGFAVVTFDNAGSVGVEAVDVSSCFLPVDEENGPDVDASDCDATVDLVEGIMHIPCLKVNGETYDIYMDRRGNSMNFEVTIANKTN